MELSLDTASELASIALSRQGVVSAEKTWRCQRNHTVELLPAVEALLADAGATKSDIDAVFVSTGPGMYTGLRVGVTIAKTLAHALGTPLVGVMRLELDAYPHRDFDGEVIAVHRAGRGELAWASYRGGKETNAPQLSKPAELADRIRGKTRVAGEVDEKLRTALGSRATIDDSETGRARALAELGYARLLAGETSEPALLKPLYLRPPAIGPQPPAVD